jgi:sulfite reductase (NADPH) flavoprotein alpha-component
MDLEAGLKRGPFTETQISQLIELVPGLDSGQVQWLNGYLTGISLSFSDIVLPPQERADVLPPAEAADAEPIWILYGTHTGNCEKLARQTAERLARAGKQAKVQDMGTFKTKTLKNITRLLVIVSTDGEGEPPPPAEELHAFLRGERAFKLEQMRYSVLSLGDTSYSFFCQTGKDFDEALEKLGARRISARVDCDVDYEQGYEQWISELVTALGSLSVRRDGVLVDGAGAAGETVRTDAIYDRSHPFRAKVLNKINLNGRGSTKETLHLELDLSGSGLHYQPGDALGVYGFNPPRVVNPVLEALGFTGEETVETHRGSRRLSDALREDYELTPLTAYSLSRYAELTGSGKLKDLVSDHAATAGYVYGRDLLDLIGETPFKLTPQSFVSVLRKNTARMYSIASSPQAVDEEVHIVVSVVRYEAYGRKRLGHCSSYLLEQAEPGDELLVFVDENSRFRLPDDASRPIIMVGAGTGVAPYRAFLQQREALDHPGRSWLFFGDRNFRTDFLYQTEWLQYLRDGSLTRADVAFSRDQAQKLYVQDRMAARGRELYEWLQEGAHFYVCGDKSRMARDVDHALRQIIQTHGAMTEDDAREYVKRLQRENRYQTDVY